MVGAGYDVDFVGSLDNGSAVFADSQHEGHGGFTADQIRNNIYNCLVDNPSQVVSSFISEPMILMIPRTPAVIVTEVYNILDEIDRYESDHGAEITVILALIINRLDYTCTNPLYINIYNNDLEDMALRQRSSYLYAGETESILRIWNAVPTSIIGAILLAVICMARSILFIPATTRWQISGFPVFKPSNPWLMPGLIRVCCLVI